MTDPKQPEPGQPVGVHYLPDDDWAQVVRRAAELRGGTEPDPDAVEVEAPEIEVEVWEDTDGGPKLLRPAGRLLTLPRQLVPVLDWTGRGRACGKYFPVSGIPTQLLVLHSAECPLQAGFAQSLTEWALTSNVVASWHRFIGPDRRVYMIPDELAAWHASEANNLSIGWEQAGYAAYSRAQWTGADGLRQLDSLAYDMAQVAKRDGIPPVWLSTSQVRAVLDSGNRSIKGFCTHRQIDPESRTDPGNGYPYDLLMAAVKKYLNPAPTPVKDWLDMATQAQVEAAVKKAVEPLVKQYGWWYKGSEPKDAYHTLVNTPAKVWAATVTRGGKKISVLQEIADCKTLGEKNAAALAELQSTLDQILAAVKSGQQPPAAPPA